MNSKKLICVHIKPIITHRLWNFIIEGIRDRVKRLKTAYLATKQVYKNKCPNAIIRHYKATLRSREV